MNFNRNTTLPAAIALAISTSAFAQNHETELSPVVVTANRVARTADETLAAITIITRKDIEQQQAQSVPDLLRGLPGIQLVNNGGPGKVTSLQMRGSNSDQTLVLVDGVKIGAATTGSASLQDIPLDQIERIEIVRGPRASLYGSEAIGGVVQIFTRKAAQPVSFSMGGGSRGTYEAAISGGFGSRDAWLNVGASGFGTHGINVREDGTEPDRDGYTRSNFNVRAGGHSDEHLSYEAQARHTEARNKFDGSPNITDLQQDLYAGELRYAASEKFTTALKLAQTLDATKNFKDESYRSRFDTRRSTASWQNDFTLSKNHQLVAGFDYQYDEVMMESRTSATGTFSHLNQNKRSNKAAFAQYLAGFGAFDLQLAGRHDQNEQFGHHNTGSLAAGYAVSPDLRLRASYGTGFKAPTFNALYYPYSGDASLSPEKSRNKEIGLSGKTSTLTWDISAFDSYVSNMVEWIESPPGTWSPYNTTARIRGAELASKVALGNTSLGLSYTQLLPTYDVEVVRGNMLVRRARQSGKVDVDHSLGAWKFGATIFASGKRYNDAANTVKLGGYATLDLRAEYTINASWRVQTRIENALDKRYETAYSYRQPGVGAFVTLRYQAK